MTQELTRAIIEMREGDALRIAREMLDRDVDPLSMLEACREGVDEVGRRFEGGTCFIPELILTGEVLSEIKRMIKPRLARVEGTKSRGKIVVGTVEGDIHDIGKDIVAFMLDANGFEVYDLGVDVPARRFVDRVHQVAADVVALSGLLTAAYEPMRKTVEALKEAGLRDKVKVMMGGVPADDRIREHIGADAWGKDAMAAVSLAKAWTGGN